MPIEWWLYPAFGIVAGLLAGLLGVGGGLVLVAGLTWLLPREGVPVDASMHAALATSLATIVITGLASARAHNRRGSVLWPSVFWLLPGLLIGGWLGSGLATRLSGAWLRDAVALYCLLAAMQLWLDWPRAREVHEEKPRGIALSIAGVFIGILSALVGIGGGSMTVPLLVWRGVPAVRAVGTSSACGVGIGLASALGYATHSPSLPMPPGSWGYVYLPAAIGIAITSMLCAPYGARLAHRLSGPALKRIFAVFLLAVGLAMALS